MNFSDYLELARRENHLQIDSSWAQGTTTFGGLSAALLFAHLEPLTEADETLRSLSVNFCGPLRTEQDFHLTANSLRQGKSIHHLHAHIDQQGERITELTACFAKSKTSSIAVPTSEATLGPIGEGKLLPYIKGLTPEFTRHIDFAYCAGNLPFTNSKENCLHGWMRFKQEAGLLTTAHLIALIDAWPPTVIQKLKTPAPCATVSWSLEVLPAFAQAQLDAQSWLWYQADIAQASEGYGNTQARIYSSDGKLLALSHQLVVAYG